MQKLRNMPKQWLAAAGLAVVVGMAAWELRAAEQVVIQPGWRYTDGYWNYWEPTDRAWYYTDGRNWYTYGDNAWRPYAFDRNFGKSAFYREGYVAPQPGPTVVVPRHQVYVPR